MAGKGLAGLSRLQGAGPYGALCGVKSLPPLWPCRAVMRLSQWLSSGACGPGPICMGL